MNIIVYGLVVTISMGLTACATPYVDNGGRVSDYKKTMIEARKNGTKVVIDYECNSACLIKLSSGDGLCVSTKAKFGVHESRVCQEGVPYDQGTRDEERVNFFKSLLPDCAVTLFESKDAFGSPKLTYFSGKEVLKSCPEIKECTE